MEHPGKNCLNGEKSSYLCLGEILSEWDESILI